MRCILTCIYAERPPTQTSHEVYSVEIGAEESDLYVYIIVAVGGTMYREAVDVSMSVGRKFGDEFLGKFSTIR